MQTQGSDHKACALNTVPVSTPVVPITRPAHLSVANAHTPSLSLSLPPSLSVILLPSSCLLASLINNNESEIIFF